MKVPRMHTEYPISRSSEEERHLYFRAVFADMRLAVAGGARWCQLERGVRGERPEARTHDGREARNCARYVSAKKIFAAAMKRYHVVCCVGLEYCHLRSSDGALVVLLAYSAGDGARIEFVLVLLGSTWVGRLQICWYTSEYGLLVFLWRMLMVPSQAS